MRFFCERTVISQSGPARKLLISPIIFECEFLPGGFDWWLKYYAHQAQLVADQPVGSRCIYLSRPFFDPVAEQGKVNLDTSAAAHQRLLMIALALRRAGVTDAVASTDIAEFTNVDDYRIYVQSAFVNSGIAYTCSRICDPDGVAKLPGDTDFNGASTPAKACMPDRLTSCPSMGLTIAGPSSQKVGSPGQMYDTLRRCVNRARQFAGIVPAKNLIFFVPTCAQEPQYTEDQWWNSMDHLQGHLIRLGIDQRVYNELGSFIGADLNPIEDQPGYDALRAHTENLFCDIVSKHLPFVQTSRVILSQIPDGAESFTTGNWTTSVSDFAAITS